MSEQLKFSGAEGQGNPGPLRIVEIGAGRFHELGMWQPVTNRRPLDNGEQYIGIDIGAQSLEKTAGEQHAPLEVQDRLMHEQWRAIMGSSSETYVSFVQADGTNLPLKDGIADEVILSNMFGEGAPNAILPLLLKEANRILKNSGTIIIQDDLSPHPDHILKIGMQREIAKAGFDPDQCQIEGVIQGIDPFRYRDLAQKYGFDASMIRNLSTIWRLSKPTPLLSPQEQPARVLRKPRWWRLWE